MNVPLVLLVVVLAILISIVMKPSHKTYFWMSVVTSLLWLGTAFLVSGWNCVMAISMGAFFLIRAFSHAKQDKESK